MYRLLLFLFLSVSIVACRDGGRGGRKELLMEAFSEMRTPGYVIDTAEVRRLLVAFADGERGRMAADRHTREYYRSGAGLLWVCLDGVGSGADSLVQRLKEAGDAGVDVGLFRIPSIEGDLARLRQLGFDDGNRASEVVARLEYNLTRAYLRYSSAQAFGFVNPEAILNRLYQKEEDSTRVTYFRLYDVKTGFANGRFFNKAIGKVRNDSVCGFLREIQPRWPLYHKLVGRLAVARGREEREKIICNIERCRWNVDRPVGKEKYIVVNIPSFSLFAANGDSVLAMKIGCGEVKTKTPLLSSGIMRMDLNPQWIVPKSIAKGIIYSTGYLMRENMSIYEKGRGKVGYEEASYTKLMEGRQFIVQAGGQGNSLGRIIFRFMNNFSVYLHDTSSPWIFQRANRAVSHGCVRVERPFDLAVFLLGDKDDGLIEKIRYSMTADIGGADDGKPGREKARVDRSKLVSNVKVSPEVPLYIMYYTYFTDKDGNLEEYGDVYGYDQPIIEALKPYIK